MGSAGSQDSKSLKTCSAPPLRSIAVSPTTNTPQSMHSSLSSPGMTSPRQSPMSISSSEFSFMMSPSFTTPFNDMLISSDSLNRLGSPSTRSQSVPANLKAPIMTEANINLGGKDCLSLYMDTETMIRNLVLPHTSTEYRNVFLLTFRAYISPVELLGKLLAYFSHPQINLDNAPSSTPTSLSPSVSPGTMRTSLLSSVSPIDENSMEPMSTSATTSSSHVSSPSSRASSHYSRVSSPSTPSPSQILEISKTLDIGTTPSSVSIPSTPVTFTNSTTPVLLTKYTRDVGAKELDSPQQKSSSVGKHRIIEDYVFSRGESPEIHEIKRGRRRTLSVHSSTTPPTFRDRRLSTDSEPHSPHSPNSKRHKDRDESKSLPQLPAHWRESISSIDPTKSLRQTAEDIQRARTILKLKNMSRIKVAGVLQHWVRDFFEDFTPSMRQKLREFAEEIEQTISASRNNTTLPPLNSVLRVLESKEEQFMLTAPTKNGAILEQQVRWVVHHEDFPDRLIIEKFGGGLDLLEQSPEQVAQQLTLIEFPIFKRIRLIELTDQSWTRKPVQSPKPRKRGIDVPAPNAKYFIKQFNRMSYWCATEVLLADTTEDRCDMMCVMLEIAHHALCIQNIHLCMALCAGLQLPQVSRLKHLKPVTKNGKHSKLYKKFDRLISAKNNYRGMRQVFEECLNSGRPTLPFMAVVFKDLYSLQERTNAEQDSNTIDIRRLCKSAKLVQHIASCQHRDYSKSIQKNDALQIGLREEISRAMSEKDLRVRSLNLERKMTWEEHQQTVMIDALLNEGFL